jgi:hypothetical protein
LEGLLLFVGQVLTFRSDLDLGGLSVAFDMTIVGDEFAFLRKGLDLVDIVAGCFLFEARLDCGRQGIERDLFFNLGNCAVRSEEDIAGAAVDDGLDLVEGLAVLAFFGEALDGGAPGLGLDGLFDGGGKS